MSALHRMPQYLHGRLRTAGALSYGRAPSSQSPGAAVGERG
jgi:hypothetical protein